ncbi:MAG TPA: ATP-binding protein [Candidatus Acidoferrum sp.]|nr:ATP-binding protein [Candidatus Acidoferrum sp.]
MGTVEIASSNWKQHFSVKGYAAFFVLCAALSAAVGYGFYSSNLSWFKINKGEEKTSALQLVNAFVTTYSDVRGHFLVGDAPVPATFRARAIDKFNQSSTADATLRLSMVGVRGREIVTAPADEATAAAIDAFLVEATPQPMTQLAEVNGEPMLRTIYPSIASQQSCVDCHNKLQAGKPQWKLNDVMGAFVAEVPAGPFMAQARYDATITALLVFFASMGIGSSLFFGHARQLARRAESEATLRTAHEDLKAAVDKLATQERLAAIGQMAGTVSHELRNPLGVIRSSMTVIQSMTAGKQLGVERALERIDRNIERCSKIIGELLDFTKPSELVREPVAVDSWLGGVLDDYALHDSIALVRELQPDCEAAIDTHRFEQVFINLLDNACQALTDGKWAPPAVCERRITVRCEAAGPHVRITVADTGPGVPPDAVPKIFEPLFTTKSFGTGLGLPTVRKIVEMHGGTIDVASVPDQGATFTIWLPRHAASVQPAGTAQAVA